MDDLTRRSYTISFIYNIASAVILWVGSSISAKMAPEAPPGGWGYNYSYGMSPGQRMSPFIVFIVLAIANIIAGYLIAKKAHSAKPPVVATAITHGIGILGPILIFVIFRNVPFFNSILSGALSIMWLLYFIFSVGTIAIGALIGRNKR